MIKPIIPLPRTEETAEIIKQIYEIISKIGCDLKRIETILLSNKEGFSTFW